MSCPPSPPLTPMSLSACCAHSLCLVACLVSFSSTSTLSVVVVRACVLVCLWFYFSLHAHLIGPVCRPRLCLVCVVAHFEEAALEDGMRQRTQRNAKKNLKRSASPWPCWTLGEIRSTSQGCRVGWMCASKRRLPTRAPPKRRLEKRPSLCIQRSPPRSDRSREAGDQTAAAQTHTR